MERLLQFSQAHQAFRKAFGEFLDKEAVPYYEEWEQQGQVPREYFKKCGDLGYLCVWMEEKYGGAGGDLLHTIIQTEELCSRGLNGIYTRLHSDVVAPYIHRKGTEEQKQKWLPAFAKGDKILAIAMSEPEAGSDLASLQTKAVKNGDSYIINGTKAFISNGMLADVVVVAARTDFQAKPYKGISLFLVETNTPGFSRHRIPKVGLNSQDTSTLSFMDCRIPKENLIGEENKGFFYIMDKLQQERLVAAVNALAQAKKTLDLTIPYVKQRKMFGTTLSTFQNTQFTLAKLATEIEMAQSFLDQLTLQHMQDKVLSKEVSMAKYYCCELAFEVADKCVQMFGGYGVCKEYPISRQFVDARFLRLLAGASEVQLLIVARELGL